MKKIIFMALFWFLPYACAKKTKVVYYDAERQPSCSIDSVILDPFMYGEVCARALDPARKPVLEPALTVLAQLEFLKTKKFAPGRKTSFYMKKIRKDLTRGHKYFVMTHAKYLRQTTKEARNWMNTLPLVTRRAIPKFPDIDGEDNQDNLDLMQKIHAVDHVLPYISCQDRRNELRQSLIEACYTEKWDTVEQLLGHIFYSLPADFSFAHLTLPPLFLVQIKMNSLKEIDSKDPTMNQKVLSSLKTQANQALIKQDTKRALKAVTRIHKFLEARKKKGGKAYKKSQNEKKI